MFISLLLLYFVIIIGVFVFQKYIIFQPKKLNPEFQYAFDQPFEEFFLDTPDGEQLNALLFKTNLTRKGLVLFFHGNRGNLDRWGNYTVDFLKRGYDVFILEYRGYGKSSGQPSEIDFYKDAQLTYNWAVQKYDPNDIIIYGRSLGSGVASHLAMENNHRFLILETPFNNIETLFEMKAIGGFLPFSIKSKFPNDEYLKKISQPIYIFAGTKDKVVPIAATKKLQPSLKPNDKMIIIENGNHKNLNSFTKYQNELDQILK